jgi:hypothetical protein
MADELIRCPACDHALRLPPEFFGQTVECPQCGNRFAAPAPATAPTVRAAGQPPIVIPEQTSAYPSRAGERLRVPATILLVLSIINLFSNGYLVLFARQVVADPRSFEAQMHDEIDRQPNMKADDRARMKEMLSVATIEKYSTHILVIPGVLVFTSLLTVAACIQMLRLRAYPLCVLGSILAINPINSCPCCLLEAPFGLWCLITLMNSDVRAAFQRPG